MSMSRTYEYTMPFWLGRQIRAPQKTEDYKWENGFDRRQEEHSSGRLMDRAELIFVSSGNILPGELLWHLSVQVFLLCDGRRMNELSIVEHLVNMSYSW